MNAALSGISRSNWKEMNCFELSISIETVTVSFGRQAELSEMRMFWADVFNGSIAVINRSNVQKAVLMMLVNHKAEVGA